MPDKHDVNDYSRSSSLCVQNDLRMAKEKARRKQAIIARQEEELAAREGSLDSMRKELASSTRQAEHLQEDNKALKVSPKLTSVSHNQSMWLLGMYSLFCLHPAACLNAGLIWPVYFCTQLTCS